MRFSKTRWWFFSFPNQLHKFGQFLACIKGLDMIKYFRIFAEISILALSFFKCFVTSSISSESGISSSILVSDI